MIFRPEYCISGCMSLFCLSCSAVVTKTHQNTGKYCNLTCQADHRRTLRNIQIEEGHWINAGRMKAYLKEKHGDRCQAVNCAWDYDKQHIRSELEHIDGDSTNTTLSNCMLICPNCHSLTPTYKGKNKGNGRHARRQRYKDGLSY